MGRTHLTSPDQQMYREARPARKAIPCCRLSPVMKVSAFVAIAIATCRMSRDRARVSALKSRDSSCDSRKMVGQSGSILRNLPASISVCRLRSDAIRCAGVISFRPSSVRRVVTISSSCRPFIVPYLRRCARPLERIRVLEDSRAGAMWVSRAKARRIPDDERSEEERG